MIFLKPEQADGYPYPPGRPICKSPGHISGQKEIYPGPETSPFSGRPAPPLLLPDTAHNFPNEIPEFRMPRK